MDVRHPRALDSVSGTPPSAVSIDRSRYAVADDGTVTLPSEYEADRLASAYGVDVSEIALNQQSDDVLVNDDDEVCGAELSAGGTCDRPADECPYHSDD